MTASRARAVGRARILRVDALPALVLLPALLIPRPTGAQGIPESLKAEVQAIVDRAVTDYGIKGVLTSVVWSDGSVFDAGSGIARPGEPVDTDRLVAIGSQTKMLTAITTLQLIDDGLLGLDDELGLFIDPIPNVDQTTTVRNLLRHATTIDEFWPSLSPIAGIHPDSVFDARQTLLDHLGPPRWCATIYCPQNTSALLLGLVIQAVSGRGAPEEISRRIFEPLGLDGAAVAPVDLPYTAHNGSWDCSSGTCFSSGATSANGMLTGMGTAAGGVATTGHMARIIEALMDGRLTRQETLHLVKYGGVARREPSENGFVDYGLGLEQFVIQGDTLFGHQGAFLYYSRTFYNPALRIGLSIAFNTQRAGIDLMRNEIYAAMRNAVTTVDRKESPTLPRMAVDVWPNPASGRVSVSVIPDGARPVRVSVFDVLGREVTRLHDGPAAAPLRLEWDSGSVPAGVYLIRSVGGGTVVKTVVVQ